MVKSTNLAVAANGNIGRSHGGIVIILINTPHSFLSFLFSTCMVMYIVLFIKLTFASMTKFMKYV